MNTTTQRDLRTRIGVFMEEVLFDFSDCQLIFGGISSANITY